MLQQMRDGFRYLKWLLVIIIFMFIWWAFATWGGGASSRRQDGDHWAARVNGEEIPIPELQSYARRLDSTYQAILGEQYAQQRSSIHLGQQAINGLVEQELVYQEAVRQGIRVSLQEVAEAITRDPSLQENGRFIGIERYRNLFRGGGVGIAEYEAQVRRDLVVEKFRSLIEDAVIVSDAEVEQEFLKRNRKATVEYLVVDLDRLRPKGRPTESEVARYYDDQRSRYSRGEGRTGVYVLFSPNDGSTSASITEAELKAAYDRDLATRYTVPEQRRASHILFKVEPDAKPDAVARVEKEARAILKRARAGEDFAQLARTHSQDSGTAAKGGDLDYFGHGRMVPEFDKAAFSLAVGAISDLVRTPYGFHILKVTGTREGQTLAFDAVREQIREQLTMDRSRDEILKRSADFARAAAGGKLEAVAKSQGLTIRPTGTVHEGDALPDLTASQPVVARMMTLAPGESSDPIPVPSGQVVVQVTGTAPSEPRPLQEIRAKVEADFKDEKARAALKEKLSAIQRAGGGLKTLAHDLKVDLKTQADVTREASLPGLPADPAITSQIASLAPGSIGEPVVTPAGIVVLGVKDRQEHRDEFETQKDSIRDNLARQRQDRLYRALLKRLRAEGTVVLNEPVVHALDQG
jgi:peptidyl-prolyl cis-trans isomerase D